LARFAFFFFRDTIGFGGVFSAARNVPMNRRCASSSLYCSLPGAFAMPDSPPGEPDITKEHYEAVGRVSNAWATFEFYTDKLIWWAANVAEPIGACITAQYIGPGPRFRALAALVKLRGANADLIKAINKFSTTAQGVAGERNRWAHDPMFVDVESGEVLRYQVTADRALIFELKLAVITDMVALEKKIWGAVNELNALGERIHRELSALPRTPPQPPQREA
jgi:hypothetical protein